MCKKHHGMYSVHVCTCNSVHVHVLCLFECLHSPYLLLLQTLTFNIGVCLLPTLNAHLYMFIIYKSMMSLSMHVLPDVVDPHLMIHFPETCLNTNFLIIYNMYLYMYMYRYMYIYMYRYIFAVFLQIHSVLPIPSCFVAMCRLKRKRKKKYYYQDVSCMVKYVLF